MTPAVYSTGGRFLFFEGALPRFDPVDYGVRESGTAEERTDIVVHLRVAEAFAARKDGGNLDFTSGRALRAAALGAAKRSHVEMLPRPR